MDLFSDLSKATPCITEWGKWSQSSEEVHIEVDVPKGTKSRDIKVDLTNSNISVNVAGKIIFSGALYKKVKSSEMVWSLENGGSLLDILLVKSNYSSGEEPWSSLMEDSRYKVEESVYDELKKNVELEKLKEKVMEHV